MGLSMVGDAVGSLVVLVVGWTKGSIVGEVVYCHEFLGRNYG
jgi:hypothetical protein